MLRVIVLSVYLLFYPNQTPLFLPEAGNYIETILRIAEKLEIYEDSLERTHLVSPYDFDASNKEYAVQRILGTLNGRLSELITAPPLYEIERLPPADYCFEMQKLNIAYIKELKQRKQLDAVNGILIDTCIEEAQILGRIWDSICACYLNNPIGTKRWNLHNIRSILGYRAFYSGHWPSPVPLWRLPER